MRRPARRAPATIVAGMALLGWLLLTAAASAQQQRAEERACTLVLEPATDSTQSVRIQVEPNRYVTHVSNGLLATCGDARMNSDSAVSYGGEQRVRMIGSVDYRDSVRTLTADTLTYFQAADRVLAVGDVVLVRRASGSRLSGPRVEFLRVRSPEERRTVATGRSRLEVYPDSAPRDTAARDTASPAVVDADRIVMLGEREARTWGDVRIRRSGTDARADSAFFHMESGTGRLMGAPRVDGETFTLTGDTIFTGFEEGELQDVESVGEARATGEDFDLYSERIRGRMGAEELDRMWAYGAGRSVAVSPPYRLAADSLDTAFAGGEMDTLYAVGSARALEIGDRPAEDPRSAISLTAGERSWMTGDTLIFSFARHAAAAPADSVEMPEGDAPSDSVATEPVGREETDDADVPAAEGETRLERVRAAGDARAYHVLRGEDDDEPARDYQLARVIEIFFEDGEVARVEGQQAVGIHLDPMEDAGRPTPPPSDDPAQGDRPPPEVPPDTTGRAVSDSVREAPPDTTDRDDASPERPGLP